MNEYRNTPKRVLNLIQFLPPNAAEARNEILDIVEQWLHCWNEALDEREAAIEKREYAYEAKVRERGHSPVNTSFTPIAVYPDGNQWCALQGENLQEGVAGFGNTPQEALAALLTTIAIPVPPEEIKRAKEGCYPKRFSDEYAAGMPCGKPYSRY